MKQIFRMLKDSRKQWGWFAVCVTLLLCSGLLKTGVAALFGRMTDFGVTGNLEAMTSLVLPMAAFLLADVLRNILTNTCVAYTTEKMFLSFRERVFQSLARVKMDVLERKLRSGDVIMRVNGDLSGLCEQVAGQYSWFARLILTALVALIACVFISWQMSLAYFLIMPVSLWVMKRQSAPLQKRQRENSEHTGKAMNVAADMLHGLMVTKSFCLEDEMDKRFGAASQAAVQTVIESEKIGVQMNAVKYVTQLLPLSSMLILGVWLVSNGIVTPGTVISFITLSAYVREAVELGNYMMSGLRRSASYCGRLYEILDLPAEAEGEQLAPDLESPAVAMDKAAFAYEDTPELYHDVSMAVKQGQRVGIVGPSGCGKSTLIKLICRFYTCTGGSCTLFGYPAGRWSPQALRREISIVTQEPFLFDGTICENVMDGRPDATRKDVENALRGARLWDFVSGLPKGMDTPVGEGGARLSGGQRQRVSIARALCKDARLVLLDEATSALDVESEKEVQAALDVLLEGRAAVIVAHRLSTLRNADKIYFMENGVIAEHGTREELLAQKGRFYEMNRRQMQEVDT